MVANKHWTDEELKILRQSYKGCSWEELYQLLPGRSYNSIKKIAERNGLHFQDAITYNKDFFSEPNNLNCYYGGLIATDGWIERERSPVVGLKLKDIEPLEWLKIDADFTGDIKNVSGYNRIRFHAAYAWKNDLEKHFNITEKKTFSLQPPNLSKENHILSYLIGHIDGDGTISINRDRGYVYPYIKFLGTKMLLEWIREITLNYIDTNAQVRQDRNIFRYSIKGKCAISLIRILREIDVPKLDRKWNQPWLLEML